MHTANARSLAAATIVAAVLNGCTTAGGSPSSQISDPADGSAGGVAGSGTAGDTASHADDDAMLQFIAPANAAMESFRTAEIAWQSNSDPNRGIVELTQAARDAADAHHTVADQIATHTWISQAAALAVAVGPAFDDLGDALDDLSVANDFFSAQIGECEVSIAGLTAKQQYSAYILGVTGNPPTGAIVAELPVNQASAEMCRYRVPLIKATSTFNKRMASADSNQDAVRALKAMAKAEDTFVVSVSGEPWPDEVDPSVTGMVAAYRSESRHLKDTVESLQTGTQAEFDREFAQLQKAFAASQTAETVFGTALVSWQERVL